MPGTGFPSPLPKNHLPCTGAVPTHRPVLPKSDLPCCGPGGLPRGNGWAPPRASPGIPSPLPRQSSGAVPGTAPEDREGPRCSSPIAASGDRGPASPPGSHPAAAGGRAGGRHPGRGGGRDPPLRPRRASAAAGPAGLRGSAPGAHAAAGAAPRQVSGGAGPGSGTRGAAGTGIAGTRGTGTSGRCRHRHPGAGRGGEPGLRHPGVRQAPASRGPGVPASRGAARTVRSATRGRAGSGAQASREPRVPASPGTAGIGTLGRGRHPGHRHPGVRGQPEQRHEGVSRDGGSGTPG